jgi:hypothetical protein
MSTLRHSNTEKRVGLQLERRLRHVEREPRQFRLAGTRFNTGPAEAAKERTRETKRRRQRVSPVGLGFATNDAYGPNDNWDVIGSLNNISYRDYYTAQQTY